VNNRWETGRILILILILILIQGPGSGSEQKSFGSGTLGTRQPGRDNQESEAGTGELRQKAREDRWDTRGRTEAECPEHDSKDRTAKTGQPGLNNMAVGIGHQGTGLSR
jgi:hypothetical protein